MQLGHGGLGILERARRRILVPVRRGSRVGHLSSLAEQLAARAVPAGLTGLAGAAWANLDGHGVKVAAVGRALDTKGIAIEGPAARFKVEGGAVDGIQPAV